MCILCIVDAWLVYTWLKTWRLYTYRTLFALGGKSKQTCYSWTQTLRVAGDCVKVMSAAIPPGIQGYKKKVV